MKLNLDLKKKKMIERVLFVLGIELSSDVVWAKTDREEQGEDEMGVCAFSWQCEVKHDIPRLRPCISGPLGPIFVMEHGVWTGEVVFSSVAHCFFLHKRPFGRRRDVVGAVSVTIKWLHAVLMSRMPRVFAYTACLLTPGHWCKV